MKIENEFFVGYSGRTNSYELANRKFPSIDEKSKPVNDLVSILEKDIGLKIKPEDSEQSFRYITLGQPKEGAAPLGEVFSERLFVTGYILRGEGIEICLKNFYDLSGHTDRMGGDFNVKKGIAGKITAIAEKYNPEAINKIEESISNFYKTLNLNFLQ